MQDRRCISFFILIGLALQEFNVTGATFPILDQCLKELPGFPVHLGIGQPVSVAMLDLNNDGLLDVALSTFELLDIRSEQVLSKARSRVWVLFSEKHHPFQLKEPVLLYETYQEGGPALLVRGNDLMDNATPDLVVGDLSNSSVLLFNYESGNFVEKARFIVPEPYRLLDLSLVDLDKDGKVDLIVAGQYGVLALWNIGHGAFMPALLIDYGEYGDAIRLACGDFNGDGWIDIGVLGVREIEGGVGHWIGIILNKGNRVFERGYHTEMKEPALGIYFVLAAGDVDHDGCSDLVTVYNDRIVVFLGSKEGAFTEDRFVSNPAFFVPAIALHDLTGDGCLNIIQLIPEFDPFITVSITRECYSRASPRMMSEFGIFFPSPYACAVADIGGFPYLILAGAERDEKEVKTVLSLFVGCRKEGE